jgi:hypothetical protein
VAYLFNVKFFVNFITRDLQIQKRRQIYVYCVNDGHLGGNNSILYTKVKKFMIIAIAPRLEPEACRGF